MKRTLIHAVIALSLLCQPGHTAEPPVISATNGPSPFRNLRIQPGGFVIINTRPLKPKQPGAISGFCYQMGSGEMATLGIIVTGPDGTRLLSEFKAGPLCIAWVAQKAGVHTVTLRNRGAVLVTGCYWENQ